MASEFDCEFIVFPLNSIIKSYVLFPQVLGIIVLDGGAIDKIKEDVYQYLIKALCHGK